MQDWRGERGRFQPGNRFWEARSSAGPKPLFTDPDKLWECCCEYFAWNEEHPLFKDQLVTFQGTATHEPVQQMRAMSIAGLCMFLDIGRSTWDDWKHNRPDLVEVITRAESVIYRQKFEGASAELLNANIIARDLGLADKTDHSSKDGSMSPKPALDVSQLSTEALAEIMAAAGEAGHSDD